MIDIENDVFSYVANAIRAEHPDAYVVGEFVDVPARFPAVTIVEADNRVYEQMRTLNIENAVRVMYECNVYTNKASGKKTQAKEIATTMDEAFTSIGFTITLQICFISSFWSVTVIIVSPSRIPSTIPSFTFAIFSFSDL